MTAPALCPACGRSWPLPDDLPARVELVRTPCHGAVTPVDRDDDRTA